MVVSANNQSYQSHTRYTHSDAMHAAHTKTKKPSATCSSQSGMSGSLIISILEVFPATQISKLTDSFHRVSAAWSVFHPRGVSLWDHPLPSRRSFFPPSQRCPLVGYRLVTLRPDPGALHDIFTCSPGVATSSYFFVSALSSFRWEIFIQRQDVSRFFALLDQYMLQMC